MRQDAQDQKDLEPLQIVHESLSGETRQPLELRASPAAPDSPDQPHGRPIVSRRSGIQIERLDHWIERLRAHNVQFERRLTDIKEQHQRGALTAEEYAAQMAELHLWVQDDHAKIDRDFQAAIGREPS